MLKLWKLSQDINAGYDTYDSCVVVAETEGEAIKIVPGEEYLASLSTWAAPEHVKVELIGIADSSLKDKTVVCASFNAG